MYYVTTVEIIAEIDTKTGPKEKRIKKQYLVKAVSVTDAETKAHKLFSDSKIDFEVVSVTQSKIEEEIN